MIVLDASVLIAFFNADDRHHQAAERMLADAVDEELSVNSLTLAEVLVGAVRTNRLADAQRALADLEVKESPFPEDVAVRLAELRVSTGLKMPDCCVLLTALELGATVASFDDRLRGKAAEQHLPTLGDPA